MVLLVNQGSLNLLLPAHPSLLPWKSIPQLQKQDMLQQANAAANGGYNQSIWMLQTSNNAGGEMGEKMVQEGHCFASLSIQEQS